MANNPTLLKMPLAIDGDRATIPETSGSTTGEFSQKFGFQQITSLPPQAGGKAPRREDFNGAFNLLGGITFFAQKGWQFEYDAGQEYFAGCVVRDASNGKSYLCIADVSANAGLPSADVAGAHWQELPDLASFFRQPSTTYVYNDVRLAYGLKQPFFLKCTTGGTSDDDEIVLPATPTAGTTITDGTVTWTIRKIASTDDVPSTSGFANKNLSNLNTQNLSVHVVVESSMNTSTKSWYRLYDDGFIEQGGYVSGTNTTAERTINYPHSMNPLTIAIAIGDNVGASRHPLIISMGTTSFVEHTANTEGNSWTQGCAFYWIATGKV